MTNDEQGKASKCDLCGKAVRAGQVALLYDDVGEVHANCRDPWSLAYAREEKSPAPYVLLGSPMIHFPLVAIQSVMP